MFGAGTVEMAASSRMDGVCSVARRRLPSSKPFPLRLAVVTLMTLFLDVPKPVPRIAAAREIPAELASEALSASGDGYEEGRSAGGIVIGSTCERRSPFSSPVSTLTFVTPGAGICSRDCVEIGIADDSSEDGFAEVEAPRKRAAVDLVRTAFGVVAHVACGPRGVVARPGGRPGDRDVA